MVLSTVSEFYTWTTVSLLGSAGLEVQVQVQVQVRKSASVSLFQDTGLSSSLTQQNLTLLVPSSEAVAKMSSDDRSFWTRTGNLATLLRSGLDLRTFLKSEGSEAEHILFPQKSHDLRSSSSIQPQQHVCFDLVAEDETSCFNGQ